MRVHIAQKFIVCLCLTFGSSAIATEPSEHDLANPDIEQQKGDKKQTEDKNAEMLEQFAKFLKQNEAKNAEGEEATPRIIDKNFRIIDASRDELRKIFDHYPEILTSRPKEDNSAIECISNSIFERKQYSKMC